MTSKAVWMTDSSVFKLQTLTFDPFAAFRTHGVIELVIMLFAIWSILEDVETCCFKWFLTCRATETTFMISTR